MTPRIGLSVTKNSEQRILPQHAACRPISDRHKWLVGVRQRTSFRPISDESSAYQMPIRRPIRYPGVGLSVTVGPKIPIKHTSFLRNSYPLTRARDLNRSLTLLTRIHNAENINEREQARVRNILALALKRGAYRTSST